MLGTMKDGLSSMGATKPELQSMISCQSGRSFALMQPSNLGRPSIVVKPNLPGGFAVKKVVSATLSLLLSLSTVGCALVGSAEAQPTFQGQPRQVAGDGSAASQLVYHNTTYGFAFVLPVSWRGYAIVPSQWKGMAVGASPDSSPVDTGPIISIRHPAWTPKVPRQDIPIMVFTISQWNSMQEGKFHIGAAPMGPSELGRNSKYVFALPARYNFAFPPGFQEVEQILAGKPLQPTEPQLK